MASKSIKRRTQAVKIHSDGIQYKFLFDAVKDDLDAIKTAMDALVTKMNADAGITDTDYASVGDITLES